METVHPDISSGDYVLLWSNVFEPGLYRVCRADADRQLIECTTASVWVAAVDETKRLAAADGTTAWFILNQTSAMRLK